MARSAQLMLWRVKRAARGLGWPLALAFGLLAFCAAFHLTALAPVKAQVEVLRAHAARLQAHTGGLPDPSPQALPEAQLAAFYARFPAAEETPATLRRLHRLGREAGLVLERGEYRPLRQADARLLRYQITLPVRGDYPQVRRFLAQALQEMPGLALDGVGFQREHGDARQLEVQLRLTLYVRQPG